MDGNIQIDPAQILTWFLIVIGISLLLAVLLLAYILWRVRRIQLPPDADLLMTLRATPLSVVLLLDALDLSLDFLSAPFAWVILGRLGLEKLRGVTIVESLIPFTQFIPTMTAAWIFARLIKVERLPKSFRM
jgi:hypothetical protein